jgi:hypothetical protein
VDPVEDLRTAPAQGVRPVRFLHGVSQHPNQARRETVRLSSRGSPW